MTSMMGTTSRVHRNDGTAIAVTSGVSRCVLEKPDGGTVPAPATNTATLTVDGPVYLSGDLALTTADGDVGLPDTGIALCRCGASRNKPFCDGSHQHAGFRDDATLRGPESLPATHPAGRLVMRMRQDGPLMLTGPLVVVGANDRRAF